MTTTRRQFIRKSGTALASAALFSSLPLGIQSCGSSAKTAAPSPAKPAAPSPTKTAASTFGKPFGFQVWTIRKDLIADFPGTLQKMAAMGYSEVEMCSPLGYSMAGFKPLNEMSGTEMRMIVEDAGLKCTSSHFTIAELRESLDNRIEWAQQMGMKQMLCSMFQIPRNPTMDDWKKAAHELNVIGEKTKAAGIQAGFHNHHFEFQKIDGELIYPVLMEEFDPELVKMQFQVAVVNIGYQAADYFRKYPGRFISAHLTDYAADNKTEVPVGQGIVDWEDLFEAAKTGGVQNYFVEMNPDSYEETAKFLLKV